jgi:hypothetical protein
MNHLILSIKSTPAPSLPIRCHQHSNTLVRSADRQLHQVVHESLQADIVGENRLSSLSNAAVVARSVRCAGVELGEQETSLRSAGVADDESGKREAVLDEVLEVVLVDVCACLS